MDDGLAGALGLLVILLILMVWDQLVGALGVTVNIGITTIVLVIALIAGLLAYGKAHRDRSL